MMNNNYNLETLSSTTNDYSFLSNDQNGVLQLPI